MLLAIVRCVFGEFGSKAARDDTPLAGELSGVNSFWPVQRFRAFRQSASRDGTKPLPGD
jgi:hypothetical protein